MLYVAMQEFNRSLTVLSQSGRRRLIDRLNARRALFFLTGVSDHLFSSSRFPCRAICLKSRGTEERESRLVIREAYWQIAASVTVRRQVDWRSDHLQKKKTEKITLQLIIVTVKCDVGNGI